MQIYGLKSILVKNYSILINVLEYICRGRIQSGEDLSTMYMLAISPSRAHCKPLSYLMFLLGTSKYPKKWNQSFAEIVIQCNIASQRTLQFHEWYFIFIARRS